VKDQPGVAGGLLQPLADAGISVDVIVQNTSDDGTTDFTFTVDDTDSQRALDAVRQQQAVKFRDAVSGSGLAKVSIVGTGMQNSPGFAATMFNALASADVNIDMITTSEIRITCIVKSDAVSAAANALHGAFDLDKSD
jgi:aspartate kinase